MAEVELDLNKERDDARKIAVEATNKMKEYNKSYYDKKHTRLTIYKPGDLVLIRNSILKPGEDSKLKPCYKGP